MKIHSLASGSKGNCLLVQAGSKNILVDLGISYKRLGEKLRAMGMSVADLDGVLITHEHVDHISGLPVFMKNCDIKVFAKDDTWRNMKFWRTLRRNYCQSLPDSLLMDELQIEAFEIPHDAAQPVGFNLYHNGYKCSILTDVGFPTSMLKERIKNADYLVLEANHDLDMLSSGNYPQALQQRIRSNRGHLSNEDAGWLLSHVIENKNINVLLAHLSQENNTPQAALQTVADILKKTGKLHKVKLQVASQEQTIIM